MSFGYARFISVSGSIINYVPSPSGSVYTHVSGSAPTIGSGTIGLSYIRNIVFHNVGAVDETVQAWLVPSGSVPTPAYRFYNEAIPTGNTRMIEFAIPGLILANTGESIWIGVPDAGKVTMMMFGGQE